MPGARNEEDADGIILEGRILGLGANGAGSFDMAEMPWAEVWTGGWLKWMGTPPSAVRREGKFLPFSKVTQK